MIDRGGAGDGGSGGSSAAAEFIDRVPPHDIEAEMAVLGSVLLDGETMGFLVPILKAKDFYRPAHAQIYKLINKKTNPA